MKLLDDFAPGGMLQGLGFVAQFPDQFRSTAAIIEPDIQNVIGFNAVIGHGTSSDFT